jgi:hypothetical protein
VAWHDRTERTILSLFYGMMLIIGLYYLILFITNRYRRFLYFSLYVLFIGVFLYMGENYPGEHAWGSMKFYSIMVDSVGYALIPLIILLFMLFSISYLELKKTLRKWYWAIVIFLCAAGFSMLFSILFDELEWEVCRILEEVMSFIFAFSMVLGTPVW